MSRTAKRCLTPSCRSIFAKGIPVAEPIDLSDHMPVRPDVVGAVDEPAEEAIEEDLSFGDDFVL